MQNTKLNQVNGFYLHAISTVLIALAIYIFFTIVIYPYYLGPLRSLPRPSNTIKYLYKTYTERFKGNAEHLLQLSLDHGPVVHLYGNVVLLNDLSFKKYWGSYKFKKAAFYSLFDIGNRANLFSAIEKDYHSKVRKLVSPAFSTKTLENVEKAVYEVGSQGLVDHIQTNLNTGSADTFDMFQLFHCLTFDVISQLVFGTNFNTIFDEHKASCYVKILKDTLKAIFMRTMIPFYNRLPLPMEKEFKKIILDNIKLRENNTCPDILQSLIDSEDPETGERLTNDEIAAECMGLLFAGMDTTANTLTWTLYELLRNPDIYKLVESEILNEFPNFNEPIRVEKAKSSLKYLDAVLLESMRLYPVASGGMPRIVPEGGITVSGHYLPAKTIIFQPIYSLHHSPKNWKEPKVYDIQRWLGEERDNNKAKLMSFGAGPRSCIGRELAWNEMYLVLSNLIRNFKMELVEKELTPTFKFFYTPKEKRMRVKFSTRA